LQRAHGGGAKTEDDVRCQRDQFRRDRTITLGIASTPSVFDADIPPNDPAQFGEPLQERCVEGLKFDIVGHSGHEYPDAPHALGLLRARRQRPGDRYAAEDGDEIAASNVGRTASPLRP
jgi:hypothetical protein